MANLRAADAEKVKAEAAVEQAKAAIKQAKAAQEQARAKALELANDSLSLANEQKAAEVAAKIAEIKAKAEYDAVIAEQNLATAQDNLRKALADIAAEAEKLTTKEQQVVKDYKTAYDNFISAQGGVYTAEKELWEATNEYSAKAQSLEQRKAGYEKEIADAKAKIAKKEGKIKDYESKSEADKLTYGVWKDEYDAYVDSVKYLEFQKAQITKDSSYFIAEIEPSLKAFMASLAEAQEEVAEAVAEAGKGFSMVYTRAEKNAFKLPDATATVVTTFQNAVKEIDQNIRISVDDASLTGTTNGRVLSIDIKNDPKGADVAKDFIFGNEKTPNDASLASIIDALQRDSVVVDKLIKDTAGISSAVAKLNAEYKALKDTLEKGVGAYKPIADAKAAEKVAKDAKTAAEKKFTDDTTALFKAIRTTLDAINTNISYEDLRNSDSLAVWNAFIDIMKYREQVFDSLDAKDTRLYYKFYKGVAEGLVVVPVKDSVKYSELKFEGVVLNAHHEATYGGYKDGNELKFGNAFSAIFAGALFGSNDKTAYESTENCFKPNTQIKFDDLLPLEKTDNFCKTFFGDWWRLPDTGKIAGKRCNAYVSKAVKEAAADYETAKGDVTNAEKYYYTNVYSKFWGIKPATDVKPGDDTIKIGYSEKTFTDPYVIPVFSATSTLDAIYSSADSTFNWDNIGYNEDNSELKLIAGQLHKNYIKIEDNYNYTLYAKTLAAAQIEAMAKNYKENTKALGEIKEVVAAVEEAYNKAVDGIKEKKTLADSVVTAYLGEDIVEAALEDADEGTTATDIWTVDMTKSGKDREYVVDVELNTKGEYKLKSFTQAFCKDGEYNLGGQQLEAAESYLDDYAARINEFVEEGEQILADQTFCNELKTYLDAYVKALYKYKEGKEAGNDDTVDSLYNFVQENWQNLIDGLRDDITTLTQTVETAQHALDKIAAGYDPQQAYIESKEEALAKAQALLEQREVELAVAEAAYKAVLEAHGITE